MGLALLQSNDAEEMKCVRAVRIGGQDSAIKRGRLLQLAAAVQAHRLGERASDIETRQGLCLS